MAAHNAYPPDDPCVCRGTGWISLSQEVVNGEPEESFKLCERCVAPQQCRAGWTSPSRCPRPGTKRYGLDYYLCDEHAAVCDAGESEDMAEESIFYLKRWLWVARQQANYWLEMVLEEALIDAQAHLARAGEEYEEAKKWARG